MRKTLQTALVSIIALGLAACTSPEKGKIRTEPPVLTSIPASSYSLTNFIPMRIQFTPNQSNLYQTAEQLRRPDISEIDRSNPFEADEYTEEEYEEYDKMISKKIELSDRKD